MNPVPDIFTSALNDKKTAPFVRGGLRGFIVGKPIKIFAFLYLVANMAVFLSMVVFAITAWISGHFSAGYMVAVIPLTGMLSGYWIRENRYGWWRVIIIGANIALTAAILFTAIFLSPELKKKKQEKLEGTGIFDQKLTDLSELRHMKGILKTPENFILEGGF